MSASSGIKPGYIVKEFPDLKRNTIRVRLRDPFASQAVMTDPFFGSLEGGTKLWCAATVAEKLINGC
jgi:hypothetical protein